jgi:hypothetical protein
MGRKCSFAAGRSMRTSFLLFVSLLFMILHISNGDYQYCTVFEEAITDVTDLSLLGPAYLEATTSCGPGGGDYVLSFSNSDDADRWISVSNLNVQHGARVKFDFYACDTMNFPVVLQYCTDDCGETGAGWITLHSISTTELNLSLDVAGELLTTMSSFRWFQSQTGGGSFWGLNSIEIQQGMRRSPIIFWRMLINHFPLHH